MLILICGDEDEKTPQLSDQVLSITIQRIFLFVQVKDNR